MANFKKHDSGWEYRLKYKDPFTQKFREKSQRGFATKKEAQLAAVEFEKRLSEGFEQTDIKLIDFLDNWVGEYKRGTVRKNTIELHEYNIKQHIKPYFKEILLKDIKPIMYQKFINSILDNGYSRRTAELVHSTMHNCIQKACLLGKLEKNPCVGVEFKGTKKKVGIKFIESSDIPRFLKASHQYGYIYWIFFKLLIETGMRKGEAAALKWDDIDFTKKTISINETLDFTAKNKSELFGDTKTFRSTRVISMSQSLANDLRYHMNWQNQNKLALNDTYHHDLNLVLCREDGNFMPKSSLFNAFSRILKRAGLLPLPIHSLGHTHAVMLLESGADMKYVQERLGHGSIQITSDVYSHISKKLEVENMKRYEENTQHIFRP